eukprot:TRINITY_DN3328_c2_g2_i1.p1 TRINITY_DN3328_c2_g2~~TRINITY_DN3328_c2_g2_i1.p1  ORF type:complete len:393 (-),score=115.08 TRINITY_DN3328_c2_g2_i1:178-1356(-)
MAEAPKAEMPAATGEVPLSQASSCGSEAAPAAAGAPAAAAAPPAVDVSLPDLISAVKESKAVLEDVTSSEDDLLQALAKLHSKGALPTKVLSETQVGKTVNALAKGSPIEKVRTAALELVNCWKQTHRKRKAESAGLSLGRSMSNISVDSEAALGASPRLSQMSTDSLTVMEAPAAAAPADGAAAAAAAEAAGDAPAPDAAAAPTAAEDVVNQKLTPQREKVRQKLVEALGSTDKIEVKEGSKDDDQEDSKDPAVLGAEIEAALFKDLPSEKEYLAQARAILFNLKDKRNPAFKFKLLVGFITPDKVAKLGAADMASDEKNAERRKMAMDAMAAIDQDWAMKNGQIRISGMFTCGKCKGTQTTYFQMQTRSSDEPMTTFATCLSCGNRWKFC